MHFDGIDSDFTFFQKVISFFQQVDEAFKGADYTELRKFLKHEESEKIQSLPIIDDNHPIHEVKNIQLASLNEQIAELETSLDICKSDIEQIKAIKVIFNNPEQISKNQIVEFPVQFKQLLETREVLRSNGRVKNIMGTFFKEEMTDENELRISLKLALNLVDLDEGTREVLLYTLNNGFSENLKTLISQVIECGTKVLDSLKKIASITKTRWEDWWANKSYTELSKWMELASKDKNGLLAYSQFVATKNNLQKSGYKPLVEALFLEGQTNIADIVEALIMRKMTWCIYNTYGESLKSYNGNNLHFWRKQLQEADRKIIKLSRKRLQSKLYNDAVVPPGISKGNKSEYTELALLRNEISKKKRHIPIRNLTQRAAKALLELKPCWMISPLAVAQYIPRGVIEFDLVIIDEASQMTPENSIGVLVRAKQAMVVGDTKQLPPTNFFKTILEDEEADEDIKVTNESILEMADSCFKTRRQLRWHYRSRHPALISFSNKYVYNNQLMVFPSTQENNLDMGVSYVKVNGIYSSGCNPKEAKVMVDEIIKFMRMHKNKSLGIVLMNKKQCGLLNEEWEYAFNQYTHTKDYVKQWEEDKDGLESFFIKNIENVQGDERDVIFIGTVYGPEKEGGVVRQNFGPINGINGKRRLNVLFSRAKERIVTFSSMTASDIRAEKNGRPGMCMLKYWLEYAKSKGKVESCQYTGKEPDSPLEEHVIRQIESIGCETKPQVGVAGYFIDIGVRHSEWPHGYIMGVEVDGARYHSSRSARDRDSLRQEILEDRGWYIYRIWSTNWFENQRRETEKLRQD